MNEDEKMQIAVANAAARMLAPLQKTLSEIETKVNGMQNTTTTSRGGAKGTNMGATPEPDLSEFAAAKIRITGLEEFAKLEAEKHGLSLDEYLKRVFS